MALRVGVAGCGQAGGEVARALAAGAVPGARLAALWARRREQAEALAAALGDGRRELALAGGLDELAERADLLVEALAPAAVPDVVRAAAARRRDALVLSAGGLLERDDLVAEAERAGVRVHVPSGAIAGLDGVKAAAVGGIDSALIETRKPPRGLAGAPYLAERGIDVMSLTGETLLFEGAALDACRGFPSNVNVAAALSLAGVGPRRTRVRIYAVPGQARNVHDVTVEGPFGLLRIHVENVPTANPRTGRLTAQSVLATLGSLAAGGLKVGS
jgi:aspartate dehydrogenase